MIHHRKVLTKFSEVQTLIKHIHTTGYCSFDFETCGKYYEPDGHLTILGVSFQPGSGWVIPMDHPESKLKRFYNRILRLFQKEVFENPNIIKIAWNIQFEFLWLRRYGIIPTGRCLDALLAKYTLHEERPNDLGYVSGLILPAFAGFKDETEKLAQKYGWGNIPLEPLSERNALDCDTTLRLMLYFEEKLIKLGMYRLYRNLVMMMARNLHEVSFFGIDIDVNYLSSLETSYTEKLSSMMNNMLSIREVKLYEKKRLAKVKMDLIESFRDQISQMREDEAKPHLIRNKEKKLTEYLAGVFSTKKDQKLVEPLNIGSGKQLIDFLFYSKHGLGLDVLDYTKNKKTKQVSKTPSTNEDHLKKLKPLDDSGFIQGLLEYNKVSHLYSTYVKGLRERLGSDNKVHTSFLVHGTVTGRLSSKDPNLQNIPRGTTAKDIKKLFVAPKGYVLLELDYSQAELRIVAELSQDKAMIDIFKRGYNIHVATACKVNNQLDNYEFIHKKILKDSSHPDNLFWEKQKKRAKLINFGILYGQTEYKLSIELECSEDEARDFINQWFEAYPQAKAWIDKQHKKARKNGFVENLFGRRRRLPQAQMTEREAKNSGEFGFWLEALRQSVNAPIQGSSSDLTQFSSVIIRERILKGEIPASTRQVYTVHDSIGFYIKPRYLKEIVPKMVEICANPDTQKYFGFTLNHVTMKVSPEVGIDWGSLDENYSQYLN